MASVEEIVGKIEGKAEAPAPIVVPPSIAANICKLLERVQVTGMESVAWVEAYQLLQQIAGAGK
jgi:hypothetical protein